MGERFSPELQDLHAYVDNQLAPDARQRVDDQSEPLQVVTSRPTPSVGRPAR